MKHFSLNSRFDSAAFEGLHIHSNGDRPSVRDVPMALTCSGRERRVHKRATEAKVEDDLRRQTLRELTAAIRNKVVLDFRVSEYVQARERGQVPLQNGGPFQQLKFERTVLKASDGPRLVVDLDDVIVFFYFPRHIGKGMQINVLDKLADVLRLCAPDFDEHGRDRRGNPQAANSARRELGKGVPNRQTRSQTAAARAVVNLSVAGTLPLNQGEYRCGDSIPSPSEPGEGRFEKLVLSHRLKGFPAIGGQSALADVFLHRMEDIGPGYAGVLDRNVLLPSKIYLTPGWYGPGMYRVKEIAVAAKLREMMQDRCRQQTVNLLESKRIHDRNVTFLMGLIHPDLLEIMQRLQNKMGNLESATADVITQGWTSCFPCFGFGINRQTTLHRDSNGMRGGLDVIGVLGDFTGGDFHIQELNLVAEWGPGSLGALDGYDFSHEVKPWSGKYRVTMISFCRASTWDGLGVDRHLSRPTLSRLTNNVHDAWNARTLLANDRTATRRKNPDEEDYPNECRDKYPRL
ncbi:hypothetical protein FRC11_006610 [Ceratobasidium sp. 423]|nr:hypothetical protein FRC11_006610 [Ceratobasidium sp. 423]